MEVALEGKDLESIHQYAHKIKSSIQIFGLKEFCSIHKDIFEFSSEKKNIENIRTLFEIQQKQIPGIIEQLDTIIAHHNE
jgi:HPt (histidine-containing phosphotransfer) domain-containing protein